MAQNLTFKVHLQCQESSEYFRFISYSIGNDTLGATLLLKLFCYDFLKCSIFKSMTFAANYPVY